MLKFRIGLNSRSLDSFVTWRTLTRITEGCHALVLFTIKDSFRFLRCFSSVVFVQLRISGVSLNRLTELVGGIY